MARVSAWSAGASSHCLNTFLRLRDISTVALYNIFVSFFSFILISFFFLHLFSLRPQFPFSFLFLRCAGAVTKGP